MADLVIDETSGDVVAEAPLPDLARFAYPLPHAWWSRPTEVTDDPLLVRKWILGGALLVGVERLELTVPNLRFPFDVSDGPLSLVAAPQGGNKLGSNEKAEVEVEASKCVANCLTPIKQEKTDSDN